MDFITFFETVEKSDFEDGDIMWTRAYNFDPPNAHGVQGVVKFENDTWKINSVLTSNLSQKHLVWPAQLRWKLSVVKNNNIKAVDGRDRVTWNKDDVGKCDWTDCIKISHDDLQRDELVDTDVSVTFMWFVELAVAFSLSTTGKTREAISEYSSEETVDTTDAEWESKEEMSQDARTSQVESNTQGGEDKTSIPLAKVKQRAKGDGKEDKTQSSKNKGRISRLEQENRLKDNIIKQLKNDIEQKYKTYKSHNAKLQAENERLRTENSQLSAQSGVAGFLSEDSGVEDEGEIEVEPTRRDNTRSDLHYTRNGCMKHPTHEDFIPVDNFHLQHLPESHRHRMHLDYIMNVISLTVRLVVGYISFDRPDKYPLCKDRGKHIRAFGSGKVIRALRRFTDLDGESCPCPQCEKLDEKDRKKQWAKFLTATARYVVYNAEEARHTQVDIDYNTDTDRDIPPKLHGMSVTYCNTEDDLCLMSCVTHDRDVALMLDERIRRDDDLKTKLKSRYTSNSPTGTKSVVIVSHPHGLSKHISVGEWRGQQEEKPYKWRYTTATCPGSGGAPVCVLGDLQGKYISVSTHSTHNRDTGYNESGSDGLFL